MEGGIHNPEDRGIKITNEQDSSAPSRIIAPVVIDYTALPEHEQPTALDIAPSLRSPNVEKWLATLPTLTREEGSEYFASNNRLGDLMSMDFIGDLMKKPAFVQLKERVDELQVKGDNGNLRRLPQQIADLLEHPEMLTSERLESPDGTAYPQTEESVRKDEIIEQIRAGNIPVIAFALQQQNTLLEQQRMKLMIERRNAQDEIERSQKKEGIRQVSEVITNNETTIAVFARKRLVPILRAGSDRSDPFLPRIDSWKEVLPPLAQKE